MESGVPACSPRAAPSLSSHSHPLQKHLLTACPLKKQETPTIHSHPKEGNQTVLSVLLTPAKGAPVTLQGAPSGSSWPPQPCLANFVHFPPLLWQDTNEKVLSLCLIYSLSSVCSLQDQLLIFPTAAADPGQAGVGAVPNPPETNAGEESCLSHIHVTHQK